MFHSTSRYSVGDTNFNKHLALVKQFVDDFEIGNSAVELGAFAFANLTGNGFHFNCCFDKTIIKSNVDTINYDYMYGQDFEMVLAFARNSIFQTVNGARAFDVFFLTVDLIVSRTAEVYLISFE